MFCHQLGEAYLAGLLGHLVGDERPPGAGFGANVAAGALPSGKADSVNSARRNDILLASFQLPCWKISTDLRAFRPQSSIPPATRTVSPGRETAAAWLRAFFMEGIRSHEHEEG